MADKQPHFCGSLHMYMYPRKEMPFINGGGSSFLGINHSLRSLYQRQATQDSPLSTVVYMYMKRSNECTLTVQ